MLMIIMTKREAASLPIPLAVFSSYEALKRGIMSVIASDPNSGLPRLKPNVPRILEAILYVIETAIERGVPATKYEIAKSIFIADWRHLEEYGRPITYDNYSALPDGPVPSLTLSILEPDFNWRSIGHDGGPPWKTEPAPRAGKKAIQYVHPERHPDLERLSETDVQALSSALIEVQKMGFHKTRDFTHDIPAYVKAWSKRGTKRGMLMDYRDLAEDDGLVSDLVHASQFI